MKNYKTLTKKSFILKIKKQKEKYKTKQKNSQGLRTPQQKKKNAENV